MHQIIIRIGPIYLVSYSYTAHKYIYTYLCIYIHIYTYLPSVVLVHSAHKSDTELIKAIILPARFCIQCVVERFWLDLQLRACKRSCRLPYAVRTHHPPTAPHQPQSTMHTTSHPLHHINHNPQCTPPPTHCTTSTTIHNAHHLPPTALHSNKSPCTPPPIHQPLTTISSLLTETSRAPKLPLTLKQLCTHVVGVTFLLTQSIATIETSRAPKLRLTIKQPSTHVVLTALQQTRIRTKFRLTTHN